MIIKKARKTKIQQIAEKLCLHVTEVNNWGNLTKAQFFYNQTFTN